MAEKTDAPTPSKLPTVLGVLNTLLTAAALAVLVLRPAAAAKPPSEAHAAEDPGGGPAPHLAGPTFKMADFVVHLRNTEAERYARLSLELELGAEADRDRLTPFVPRLRDAFVGYFSDRTAEELSGSEALARTKVALLKVCEDLVPGRHIRALYFTDFVVQ
jgi:flagellar protein FliL